MDELSMQLKHMADATLEKIEAGQNFFMPKPLKRRELIRLFLERGFRGPFSGGRHAFMVKGNLKVRVPNPHGDDVGFPLLREILRQAGIDPKTIDR